MWTVLRGFGYNKLRLAAGEETDRLGTGGGGHDFKCVKTALVPLSISRRRHAHASQVGQAIARQKPKGLVYVGLFGGR